MNKSLHPADAPYIKSDVSQGLRWFTTFQSTASTLNRIKLLYTFEREVDKGTKMVKKHLLKNVQQEKAT